MGVLNLTAFKPIAGTLGDAGQISNGFTAVEAAVNAIDNTNFAAGRIFDPAKLMQNAAIDGDALVWDNTLTKWVPASTLAAGRPRAPRVVTSTMAGGPPASPVDGDIWIALAVFTANIAWAFRYNAGSGSTSKWEFIGGSAWKFSQGNANAVVNTGNAAGGAFFFYGGQSAILVPRAGDYLITGSMDISSAASAAAGDVVTVAISQGAIVAGTGTTSSSVAGANRTMSLPIDFRSDNNVAGNYAGAGVTTPDNTVWKFVQINLDIVPIRIA